MEKEIQNLLKEIDRYKQVIRDAEDALDAAIMDLEEALAEGYVENPDLSA